MALAGVSVFGRISSRLHTSACTLHVLNDNVVRAGSELKV